MSRHAFFTRAHIVVNPLTNWFKINFKIDLSFQGCADAFFLYTIKSCFVMHIYEKRKKNQQQ